MCPSAHDHDEDQLTQSAANQDAEHSVLCKINK